MTEPSLSSLVGFGAALRSAGLVVGTGQEIAFARGVVRVDARDRGDVYWSGRACLVTSSSDIATYDRVFDAYFTTGVGGVLTVRGTSPPWHGIGPGGGVAAAAPAPPPERRAAEHGTVASAWEALRDKDFSSCSADELAEIHRLVARLALASPKRRSRRTRRAVAGRRPDLRRALRDSIAEQTRPGQLLWRAPRQKPRPVVLLLDVSGSMSAYSRVLLQFAWSASRGAGKVEVFCFGTRLTRVTTALARRDPDAALADAAAEVVDWDGGTRIGEPLRTFLGTHGRRAGCRGAVVVLCSDGLERGDPDLLGAQLARLRRLSQRVIWVNPLAGGSVFEPTTRGMAAALPHVHALVSGHSLASLEELVGVMEINSGA